MDLLLFDFCLLLIFKTDELSRVATVTQQQATALPDNTLVFLVLQFSLSDYSLSFNFTQSWKKTLMLKRSFSEIPTRI
jgi:hypothetical protein